MHRQRPHLVHPHGDRVQNVVSCALNRERRPRHQCSAVYRIRARKNCRLQPVSPPMAAPHTRIVGKSQGFFVVQSEKNSRCDGSAADVPSTFQLLRIRRLVPKEHGGLDDHCRDEVPGPQLQRRSRTRARQAGRESCSRGWQHCVENFIGRCLRA